MYPATWVQVITQPGVSDLLMLFSAIGIYLVMLAKRLNPPADDRLRGLGFFLAGFGLGNILLAVTFNVGLNFQLLELPYVQSVSTSTTNRDGDSHKPGLTKSKANIDSRHRSGALVGPASAQADFSEKTWKTIKIWVGYQPQQTETFTVPSHRWAIDWAINSKDGHAGKIALKVYSADGNLVQAIGEAPDEGGIFLDRPGRYYLMITATQKYKVVVKAKN